MHAHACAADPTRVLYSHTVLLNLTMQVSMDAGIVPNVVNLVRLYTDRLEPDAPKEQDKTPHDAGPQPAAPEGGGPSPNPNPSPSSPRRSLSPNSSRSRSRSRERMQP